MSVIVPLGYWGNVRRRTSASGISSALTARKNANNTGFRYLYLKDTRVRAAQQQVNRCLIARRGKRDAGRPNALEHIAFHRPITVATCWTWKKKLQDVAHDGICPHRPARHSSSTAQQSSGVALDTNGANWGQAIRISDECRVLHRNASRPSSIQN